jgi:hypothetical protein
MCRFYTTVAIPKVLYVADLFLIPVSKKMKGTKGLMNKLAHVQHMLALHIIGSMQTSPNDTLDAHPNLLPFPLYGCPWL